MNGKVTISEKLDVTGDLSMNGIIDMCGNVKFDDVSISSTDTGFGDHLRGGVNINGGGWYLVRQAIGDTFNNDTNLEFNINRNTLLMIFIALAILIENTPIANYDEILIYSHLDNKWWVIDYNVFKIQKDVQYTSSAAMAGITNAIKYSYSSISAQALAIFRSGPYFSLGTSEWVGYNSGQADKLFYRNSVSPESNLLDLMLVHLYL